VSARVEPSEAELLASALIWAKTLRARLGASCFEAHLACNTLGAPALWLVGFLSDSDAACWSCETTLDCISFSHAGGSDQSPQSRMDHENEGGAGETARAMFRAAMGQPLRLGAYPGLHWQQERFFEAIPHSALSLWAQSPGADWEAIALGSGLDGAAHARLLAAILSDSSKKSNSQDATGLRGRL
jgi:hypothetical protein